MKELEKESENNVQTVAKTSTDVKETGTTETLPTRRRPRTVVEYYAKPILVSEKQFENVATEHKISLDLLNDSGDVLLNAMEAMVPPKDSGRIVGEYTSQGLRQIAKSICDLVQTKSHVIRSMYQITRDEI